MKDRDSGSWYMWLPWLSVVLAVFNLWGDLIMLSVDFESVLLPIIIAVIGFVGVVLAALITGAISLITQSRQLKRDGKTIDSINASSFVTKTTAERIDVRTEKQSDKIDMLVADLDHRKRMEAQFPQGMSSRDMIDTGVKEIFTQYEKISGQYREAQKQISTLKAQNAKLRHQAQQTMDENAILKDKVRDLEFDLEEAQLKIDHLSGTPDHGYVPEL